MDGIIVINKPIGYTSQQVVSKVKKELNERKAGHTGTLDPMATGVLPILLGKGTKLSKYLIEHDKKYVATIFLGQKKDTGDQEGTIIEEKEVPELDEIKINNVLKKFLGSQKQIPPMYSAVKLNGKKLYEYARQGIEVERKERDIMIYEIKLLSFFKNEIKFEVSCSKGTYIRVLCENIAENLGTVGYMSSLQRIEVNNFKIENSVQLDKVKENIDKVISIEKYFENNPIIKLDEKKLELFLNGVKLTYKLDNGLYRIYDCKSCFIGMAILENNLLKRELVV